MIYTGIGSRTTPADILTEMSEISAKLDALNFVLRSGGSFGADYAFEGPSSNTEIYLPWKHFNNNSSQYTEPTEEALELASGVCDGWFFVKRTTKLLWARNCHQVLGYDLMTPSDLVICWTPDGAETFDQVSKKTGGTGVAIKVASKFGVPIFNLNAPDARTRLQDFLQIEL